MDKLVPKRVFKHSFSDVGTIGRPGIPGQKGKYFKHQESAVMNNQWNFLDVLSWVLN